MWLGVWLWVFIVIVLLGRVLLGLNVCRWLLVWYGVIVLCVSGKVKCMFFGVVVLLVGLS